jgi:hypothetical protein
MQRLTILDFMQLQLHIKAGSVSSGTSRDWSVDFSPSFLYVPVVTATVQNNTSSTAGNNITLLLRILQQEEQMEIFFIMLQEV